MMNRIIRGRWKLAVRLALIFSLVTISATRAKTIEGIAFWAVGPVAIDGTLDEWKGMPTTFIDEERLVIGISNDADNLYLFLRTDDVRLIHTIQMSGIQIWLDPRAKNKENLCFHYHGGPTMAEIEEAGIINSDKFDDRESERRFNRKPDGIDQKRDNVIVTDKDLELEEAVPIDGSYGPSVEFGFDHGYCVFEFSIPLEDHKIDYYGVKSGPGEKLSIGLKWGGRPDRDPPDDGTTGRMGGGNIGGRPDGVGGGMRGGAGRMGSNRRDKGRQEPPKETEFWIKTKLATSKP